MCNQDIRCKECLKGKKKLFKLLNLPWSKHVETKPIFEDLSLPGSSLNLHKVKPCAY